jgi:hypothetical protein
MQIAPRRFFEFDLGWPVQRDGHTARRVISEFEAECGRSRVAAEYILGIELLCPFHDNA